MDRTLCALIPHKWRRRIQRLLDRTLCFLLMHKWRRWTNEECEAVNAFGGVFAPKQCTRCGHLTQMFYHPVIAPMARESNGEPPQTPNYVLTRRVMDDVVTIRKVSDDGTTLDNLTDAEIQAIEKMMRDSGLSIYKPI
jgi:hypothetical protein